MTDPAIQGFLRERKEARIKSKTKASMTEEEVLEIEREASEEFSPQSWLPKAAKRAGQLSMVSHPGKFSHPSAKISSIICSDSHSPDGFLRTGNAGAGLDVFGNAATLDVYKFLSLTLQDGRTLLEHLEQESSEIKAEFQLTTTPFSELRAGFLAIKNDGSPLRTHERVKQVYFPVDEGYHLLSIATPSGLMFKLKARINEIRFSDQAKAARDAKRKGQCDEQGFAEIYNLTAIGFGGTKPQNISILNSQNGGVAYLLQSLPPSLSRQSIPPPKQSFFDNTLNPWVYRESFQAFHKLLATDYNNVNIREGRDKLIQHIVSQVIEKMWMIRQLPPGWSEAERAADLPEFQKIWLDEAKEEQRDSEDEWLMKVEKALARWILLAYRKVLGKQAKQLGDDELAHIHKIIRANEEGLR